MTQRLLILQYLNQITLNLLILSDFTEAETASQEKELIVQVDASEVKDSFLLQSANLIRRAVSTGFATSVFLAV